MLFFFIVLNFHLRVTLSTLVQLNLRFIFEPSQWPPVKAHGFVWGRSRIQILDGQI